VSSSRKSGTESDKSKIAAVRQALNQAVKDSDASRLVALATNDIVVVLHNGRCMSGKSEFERFFLQAFERWDLEGTVSSSEVLVRDKWAIEIDEVHGTRAPLDGAGAPMHTHFEAVFVFARQSDASWKVARVIELPD
jgi:uncharacterized protein (TIGR02246 family)